MSATLFKKNFTNPLLARLDASLRASVQQQVGQYLLLSDMKEFEKALDYTLGIRAKDSKVALALAHKVGIKQATKFSGVFRNKNPTRYTQLVQKKSKIPELQGLKIGVDVFIVESFASTMTRIKNAMVNTLSKELNLDELEEARLRGGVEKGHGDSGHSVAALDIASTISISRHKAKLQELFDLHIERNKVTISNERVNEIQRLFTNHRQVVTKEGDLAATYGAVIAFQYDKHNRRDGVEEKAMKAEFRKFVKQITPELVDWKGSSSLKDKIEKVLVDKVRPAKARVRVRAGISSAKLSTKASSEVKGKTEKPRVRVSAYGSAKARVRVRAKTGVSSTPLQLIGLINKKLPATIAKNMGSPRLNYRTGRFANSVAVTDIVTTGQGFPSIGYTYDKFPYQTFEPGFAQGDVNRDPRSLIDFSIREIAIQFAMGRFYTRRV